ncbi:MAG: hypothetical protein ACK5HT_20355 [Draconibacterium sp.]
MPSFNRFMAFIRRNTRLLFVFILPVYLYIVQNTIKNEHTHVFANGIVITHSHPVCGHGEPTDKHQHSQKEISLFASLHIDLYLAPVFSDVDFEINVEQSEFLIQNEHFNRNYLFRYSHPRGPPSILFHS